MLGLAKSGYKSNMKCKSLINLLYLWPHTENQIHKSGNFSNFFLTSGKQKPQKSLHSNFSFHYFLCHFWKKTCILKKKADFHGVTVLLPLCSMEWSSPCPLCWVRHQASLLGQARGHTQHKEQGGGTIP